MLNTTLQIILIAGIVIYLLLLFYLIRRRRFILKYSLLWIAFGIVMLLLALCPGLLISLTSLMGIELASNALFFLLFAFLILIVLSLTAVCSGLSEKTKELIQQTAILEARIRVLEEDTKRGGISV